MKMETPIPDHAALEIEIEKLQMCQMIPDMQWAFGALLGDKCDRIGFRLLTAQPTQSPHVNRVGLVRIAVDEWTVAGRVVDCGKYAM